MGTDARRFALYARTSTTDVQSPEDSLAWQRRVSENLIADRGEIVEVFHDVGYSRALPWQRRPVARKVIEQVRNRHRGWSDIVVAEVARAFSGTEWNNVLPVLRECGVTIWIPELGGAVDTANDAHHLQLAILGSMATAERNRARTRTREAAYSQAARGIFQGGRPPYGYRLEQAGEHPNPTKAAAGIQRTRLAINETTAPVVRQIFEWAADRVGYLEIARRLNDLAIPCPSASDPTRNSHRAQKHWQKTTVRAIVANTAYSGKRRYGITNKTDVLVDQRHPHLGHRVSRQRATDDIQEAPCPAIVDQHTWTNAQHAMSNPQHTYLFSSLLTCSECGGGLHAQTATRKRGPDVVIYRC